MTAARARPKSTGTKRTGSVARSTSSSASSRRAGRRSGYVVCLSNSGFQASLEPRKIYQRSADLEAERLGFFRVVDESGEDYLFPRALFAEIEVNASLARALK